ncbi:MAG: hypothetical protein ABW202_16075 [Duganella sp.]
MIRRFLYLLMTVVALQFSWSVVTSYCMHESGREAQHFGHHQHNDVAHHDGSATPDQPNLAKKTSAHTHCSVCAHGASSIDDMTASVFHPLMAGSAPMETVTRLSSSYTPPPERPQWLAAA